MKSYIEPLNAADALDVLDLYGIDTPGAFFSSEHEGCVEVELSGHTALLETPESVAMLFGHDAATALCQHSNFRRDAAEIMSRALDLDDFLYNVYSGTDFEIDGADADIARCLAQGGGRAAGAKVSAVYVPVGDLPRETTVFPDIARAAASIGLEDPETETLAEYGGVTVSLVRAADAEGSELKPNRAWARGGATEIVRGGFLVIATDGDGEVVDLPKWAIESAKTRFADPSTGPFQASAEFMREVRRGLGEQIEQAGRTPSDIAALASQLAAKPGDDGGAGGKRI